jgi:hypothetical protein
MGGPMSEVVAGDGREPAKRRSSGPKGRIRDASFGQKPADVPAPIHLSGTAWVIYSTLNSDEMTRRLCRIIGQITIAIAVIMLPLAAIITIWAVKAPADLKYILAGGSTVFISLGSWLLGRHRPRKSRAKKAQAESNPDFNDSG